MECPECGRTIVPLSQQAVTASTPDDAIYLRACGFPYATRRDPAARTVSAPAGEPELLFWGAPIGGGETELSQQLRTICLAVDGKADRLTEPDVVIAWPGDVFFVEVKYRSANEHKPGYAHFERYTSGAAAAGLFAGSPADVATG